MAGTAGKRLRREMGIVTVMEAYNAGKQKCAGWLDENLETCMRMARGLYAEKTIVEDGERVVKVYQREPNIVALLYLIDRVMGKVAVERNEIEDRLNIARAMFIEQQIAEGFISAQVKDMNARGERALVELEMWPKQFVTEEDQEQSLRELARASMAGLLAMTPDSFAELVPECTDPAGTLSKIKAKIGRDQSAILAAVLSGNKEQADEE